jgi:hypothetical protein
VQQLKIDQNVDYAASLFHSYVGTLTFFKKKDLENIINLLKTSVKEEDKIHHLIYVSFYNLDYVKQRNLNFILNHLKVYGFSLKLPCKNKFAFNFEFFIKYNSRK